MKENIGMFAFVLSIVGFCTGCFFVGIVLDIIAIVLGLQSRNKEEDKRFSTAAIVISIIGIILTVLFYGILISTGTNTVTKTNVTIKSTAQVKNKREKKSTQQEKQSETESKAVSSEIAQPAQASESQVPSTESNPTKDVASEAPVEPVAIETTMYAQNKVNVRSQANTSSSSLGYLLVNDAVSVVGNISADGWYEVSYKNQTGYVKGDYLGTQTVTINKSTAKSNTKSADSSSSFSANASPSTEDEATKLAQIDTNKNGKVTIAEAKAAGYKMPIYSSSWLYKYMDDRDHDGEVGE